MGIRDSSLCGVTVWDSVADRDGQAAFGQPPKLHCFVNQVFGWVVDAADIVAGNYGGDGRRYGRTRQAGQ